MSRRIKLKIRLNNKRNPSTVTVYSKRKDSSTPQTRSSNTSPKQYFKTKTRTRKGPKKND